RRCTDHAVAPDEQEALGGVRCAAQAAGAEPRGGDPALPRHAVLEGHQGYAARASAEAPAAEGEQAGGKAFRLPRGWEGRGRA
ncbi:unnamed protein product, partial [Ectocarpus fasciculatus]